MAEHEADGEAAKALGSGEGLIDFFNRRESEHAYSERILDKILSTHPPYRDRIEHIKQVMAQEQSNKQISVA